jgi:phosphate transport system protein
VSAEIESGLLRILARQAPVARDLRLVAGLLHVNEHLERMGGLCANVAKASHGSPTGHRRPRSSSR